MKKKEENIDEEIISEEFSDEIEIKIKKLKDQLKTCQNEKQEYLSGWQRSRADYLNLKKEEESKRSDIIKFAKEDVLNDLLTVVDSFDMAFANQEVWQQAPENWRKGIEYIHSQLINLLNNHGVTVIDPKGQIFDPKHQEAIGTIKVEDQKEDNIVLEVSKKGYILQGRLMRPAQVKIGILEQ